MHLPIAVSGLRLLDQAQDLQCRPCLLAHRTMLLVAACCNSIVVVVLQKRRMHNSTAGVLYHNNNSKLQVFQPVFCTIMVESKDEQFCINRIFRTGLVHHAESRTNGRWVATSCWVRFRNFNVMLLCNDAPLRLHFNII